MLFNTRVLSFELKLIAEVNMFKAPDVHFKHVDL